jgi:hypothetical protein
LTKPKQPHSSEPVPVPSGFLSPATQAISGTDISAVLKPDGKLKLTVQMSDATVARAYLAARDRFEEAGRGQDAQIALVELLTWLDVLASRPKSMKAMRGLPNVPLLLYVRGRCHHQVAFAIFDPEQPDPEAWCWLPWLPPADPGYESPKREDEYARKLAGRPVLETLRQLDRPIRNLFTS